MKSDNDNSALIIFCICIYTLLGILITGLVYGFYNNVNNTYVEQVIIEEQEQPMSNDVIIQIVQPTKRDIDDELWLRKLSQKYKVDFQRINKYTEIVRYHTNYYNINFYEIIALIGVESEFNPKAVSHLGKQYGNGLMQVSYLALLEYNWQNGTEYEIEDLYEPWLNVKIGCWYYARLRDHYKISNNTNSLLSAYNMGPYATEYNNKYVTKIRQNLDLYNE